MKWLDSKGAHYLGWTFNAWDCSSGPSLIKSDGCPTNFGYGFRAHLLNETRRCDTTNTLSVSFPNSNEWWLQAKFEQTLGQIYNVQIIFGSYTFNLGQSSWSNYEFTSSTNGVKIPNGSFVRIKATMLNIEYFDNLNWLQIFSSQMRCLTQKKIEKSLKCHLNNEVKVGLNFSNDVIKAIFPKNVGIISNVILINEGGEKNKLKQILWSENS
jgi:hypothetical protein